MGIAEFDEEGPRESSPSFGTSGLLRFTFQTGAGKNNDNSRVPYKLRYFEALFDFLESNRRAQGSRLSSWEI